MASGKRRRSARRTVAATAEGTGERDALRVLGLARRAGSAAVGTRAVQDAARAGKLALVVVAWDAGENARARLSGALREAGVPVVEGGDREKLGAAVGRGPTVVVGVMDSGLARRVRAGMREAAEMWEMRPRRKEAAAAQDQESSEPSEQEGCP